MSELNTLLRLLDTSIVKNSIIGNGNCFFHALEYALGNCPLRDRDSTQPNPIYKQSRHELCQFMRERYERELRKAQDPYEIKKLQRQLYEIQLFREPDRPQPERPRPETWIYATETFIFHAALLKRKVIVIVREDSPFMTTLIQPDGIPLTKETILFMIHSGKEHYNTLQYPLQITDALISMIQSFSTYGDCSVIREEEITIKETSLGYVLSFYPNTVPTINVDALQPVVYANTIQSIEPSMNQETINMEFARQLQDMSNTNADQYMEWQKHYENGVIAKQLQENANLEYVLELENYANTMHQLKGIRPIVPGTSLNWKNKTLRQRPVRLKNREPSLNRKPPSVKHRPPPVRPPMRPPVRPPVKPVVRPSTRKNREPSLNRKPQSVKQRPPPIRRNPK